MYLSGRDVVTAKRLPELGGRLSSQVLCTSMGDPTLIPNTPIKSVMVLAYNPSAGRQGQETGGSIPDPWGSLLAGLT